MNQKNNNYYNKALQPNANKLRKSMTKAEACLWKYALRAKGMMGYSFRRQRPIGRYIVDFVCLELKLVIEVDGITHQWAETKMKDREKEEFLYNIGFTVLRFSDEMVLKSMDYVIQTITTHIDGLHRKGVSSISEDQNPPPTPASGGK